MARRRNRRPQADIRWTMESPTAAIEPTRPPPRQGGRQPKRARTGVWRTMRTLSALMTLAFLLMTGTAAALVWFEQTTSGPGPLTETRIFAVKRGDGARSVASRLYAQGMISSENLFVARYMTRRSSRRWQSGEEMFLKTGRYELPANVSIDEIINILDRGRSVPSFLTFPEGWTTHQIVQRLLRDDRLSGDVSELPAEGVLLPATFDVVKGMSRQDLLRRMNEAQQKLLTELWPNRQPDLPIKSPAEAVILASIVQREMGPNDDPERIAAVFINRLRKGMRLESDPTILYGVHGRTVDWSEPIYRSQIRKRTDFNTYTIDGLPPTPICNPGKLAIQAVLNPATTNDLFFVADGKGGHFFAETLKGHNENVKKWREIEREIIARRKAREAEEARRVADGGQAIGERGASVASGVVTGVTVPRGGVVGDRLDNGFATLADGRRVPLPVRKPQQP